MSLLNNTIQSVNTAVSSTVSSFINGSSSEVSSGAKKLFSRNTINNLTKIGGGASGGYVNFPDNLLSRNDITQFTYFKINDKTLTGTTGQKMNTFLGAIYLPLPEELNASYKSNWGGAEGDIASAVGSNLQGMAKNFNWETIKSGTADSASYIGQKSLREAIGAIPGGTAAYENMTRSVLNPMKLMNWNAPDFRDFTFTFDLTPKSGKEAETLNKIIYYFKKYIHTPSGPRSITLEYPPLWDIHFVDRRSFASGEGNKFLFTTKECAVTNVSVDYTAKGKVFHSADENGLGEKAPNGVKLTVSFVETSILTQADFGEDYSDKVTP